MTKITNDDFVAGPVILNSLQEGLVLRSLDGIESVGSPFRYELELLSLDPALVPGDMLGTPICVSLLAPQAPEPRHFHGFVTQFDLVGSSNQANVYRATVSPWLAVLARKTDCRIFQHKSIPDIVKFVFREHGFSDFREMLSETYAECEYVVQYRETDLAFVSRLLESVGIYYYFEHEPDKHTLVMLDAKAAHEKSPKCEALPYFPPDRHHDAQGDYVRQWRSERALAPRTVSLSDYNFLTSLAQMQTHAVAAAASPSEDREVFDYPGGYADSPSGNIVARITAEEIATRREQMCGETNARGLLVGRVFGLAEHPLAACNRKYFVTSARVHVSVPETRSSGGAGQHETYWCTFTAVDDSQPYRPPRITPKAMVHGPQTAIVSGGANDEILTDEHGRVKVKFHWDRYNANDAECSCWVRVSQVWAGNQWGAMHIPRVGQEVIVDFLEGDPDRPIVVGRVYNDINKPPYTLPLHKTQSGIKSRSTPKGNPSNFNEIRFEDKKGQEDLFIHAEKTQTTTVKGAQSISVGGTRSVTVTKKDTQTFKDEQDITVTLAHTGTYHKGRTIKVNSADDVETVTGVNKTVTVHGEYNVTADTHFKVSEGADELFMKAGDVKLSNGKSQCCVELNGTALTVTGIDTLELKCGALSVKLDSKAGMISVAAGNKFEVNGEEISLTGAKKAGMTGGSTASVDLAGAATVKGTAVNLNS